MIITFFLHNLAIIIGNSWNSAEKKKNQYSTLFDNPKIFRDSLIWKNINFTILVKVVAPGEKLILYVLIRLLFLK